MNGFLKVTIAGSLALLLFQWAGCASSHLVDIWHDPGYQAPQLGRILVVSVRKDAAKRRIWEDAFSMELTKHDVAATSSYTLFPDAPPDTNQVVAAYQEKTFDGILVIHKRSIETNRKYVQGYMTIEQSERYYPFGSAYWGSYWSYNRDIAHPGYVDSQRVDVRTIDVSSTGNGGRLIWSATSRTPDPGTVTDVQKDIVGLVMAELEKFKIISSEEKGK